MTIPGEVVFDDRGGAVWHRPDGITVALEPQGARTDWARRILRGVLVDRDRRPPGLVEQACLGLGLPYAPLRRARR